MHVGAESPQATVWHAQVVPLLTHNWVPGHVPSLQEFGNSVPLQTGVPASAGPFGQAATDTVSTDRAVAKFRTTRREIVIVRLLSSRRAAGQMIAANPTVFTLILMLRLVARLRGIADGCQHSAISFPLRDLLLSEAV